MGSAQAGTTEIGTVAWREHYTPYGETLVNNAANDDQAGFTGHIKDTKTGSGAMVGAVIGSGAGIVAVAATGATYGTAAGGVTSGIDAANAGEKLTVKELVTDMAIGGLTAGIPLPGGSGGVVKDVIEEGARNALGNAADDIISDSYPDPVDPRDDDEDQDDMNESTPGI